VEWDTVGIIGRLNAEDTTHVQPSRLRAWGDGFAVSDRSGTGVRFVNGQGDLRWVYAREGAGPGEVRNISEMRVTPDGLLWMIDAHNVKIMELAIDGTLCREIPMTRLPAIPQEMVFIGLEDVLFATQVPSRGMMIAHRDSLTVRSVGRFPWSDTLAAQWNLSVKATQPRAGSDTVAIALLHGPGFVIVENGRIVVHEYLDRISMVEKVSPALREAGADSARYAARAARAVGDELFLLFGGRPRRRAHPTGEPTVLMDVYGLDGAYRRSYLLPESAHDFETVDGEVFHLLTNAEGIYPQILSVRPRGLESAGAQPASTASPLPGCGEASVRMVSLRREAEDER
jgi:hypothetical protein